MRPHEEEEEEEERELAVELATPQREIVRLSPQSAHG